MIQNNQYLAKNTEWGCRMSHRKCNNRTNRHWPVRAFGRSFHFLCDILIHTRYKMVPRVAAGFNTSGSLEKGKNPALLSGIKLCLRHLPSCECVCLVTAYITGVEWSRRSLNLCLEEG